MRILLILLALTSAYARTISVRWKETPEAFAGKIVRVKLSDRGSVEGNWISVTPDSFTLKITSATAAGFRSGVETLPRSSIQKIGILKCRVGGRVLGTIVGLVGVPTVALAASRKAENAVAVLFLAGAVAGYFTGSYLDHRAADRVRIIGP